MTKEQDMILAREVAAAWLESQEGPDGQRWEIGVYPLRIRFRDAL